MRRLSTCRSGTMKKRKRGEGAEDEEGSGRRKKAKREQDSLDKFMSLVETGDSLAGLTYFLTTVERDGDSSLISAYLQQNPSCEYILAPLHWERDQQTYDTLLLCFKCLEAILLHTASLESAAQSDSGTGMGPSAGHQLVGAILRDHMRPIYSSLMASCPMKLVASGLRLLTAMVLQGRLAARDVQQGFNFGYKPLIVFPNRTHRVQGSSDSVRTCFIKFALSFLVAGDNEVIRNILELKRFLSSVFKRLPEDPVETVHLFISTIQQKVLRNCGVSKKAKSALFNKYALKQLSLLLSPLGPRAAAEGKREEGESFQLESQESGEVVSLTMHEYILEVLTELCTSFQNGVCYRPKMEVLLAQRSNNPAILQLLLSLTGSLSDRGVQCLITRTTATCPDILTPYLQSVALSFEPRPTSKWMENMDFVTDLFSGLPSVSETLGISGCGQPRLLSLVPAAVALTVPQNITRAMFNQGVQSATPLVRLKTLTVIAVILNRAADTVSVMEENDSGGGPFSSLTQYTDSVLKLLPELKTLINLRQQLLLPAAPARSAPEQTKREGERLTPDQRISNAALLEDSSLLSLCLTVMRGYQRLSPSLFVQADFNPAKLLPSLSQLQATATTSSSSSGKTSVLSGHLGNPAVLEATLRLLEEAPSDYFKWKQQKSGVLSSLLWLVVCGNKEVSRTAVSLTLKVLLSVECLAPYSVELGVVLAAARRFCEVCLSGRDGGDGVGTEGGEVGVGGGEQQGERRKEAGGRDEEEDGREGKGRKRRKLASVAVDTDSDKQGDEVKESAVGEQDERIGFVCSLAEMFSGFTRDPHHLTPKPEQVETQAIKESGSDQRSLLKGILAAPLKLPTLSEVEAVSEEQFNPLTPSTTHHCRLLSALVASVDRNKYFPLMCDVAIKLLLALDNHQNLKTNARLLLHSLSQVDGLESGSWSSLHHSLTTLLHCWAGDVYTNMEVDSVEEETAHLSTRKIIKKMKKMLPSSGSQVVELFLGMTREQLLECVAVTATRGHLRSALLYCCDLRPLHLLGCHDHPAVQDLLPSLPLSTLLLQSFQLEPAPPTPHSPSIVSPPPLSSLTRTLTAAPLQQSWLASLRVKGRDEEVEPLWCARVMLALLLRLYRTRNADLVSAAETCFQVLAKLLALVLSPKAKSNTKSPKRKFECSPSSLLLSSDSLLTTIFDSQIVHSTLSSTVCSGDTPHGECATVADGAPIKGRRKGKAASRRSGVKTSRGGKSMETFCLEGVGGLLCTALESCVEFRRSDCFSRVFQGLLSRVETAGECSEDMSGCLLAVLRAVRPYLDPPSLLSATERILHSLTASPSSPPHQSLLSQALLTLLTPHSSTEVAPAIIKVNDSTTHSSETSQNLSSVNTTQVNGDAPINYPVNYTPSAPLLSDSCLQQLLRASVRCGSDALTQPALYLVCSRLSVSPETVSVGRWSVLEWNSYSEFSSGGLEDSDGVARHCGESKRDQLSRQLAVLSKRLEAKGVSPPFLLDTHTRVSGAHRHCSESWLPAELLSQLLDCATRRPSLPQCELFACFLLHLPPHRVLEHFSTACVPALCGQVESSVSKEEGEEEEEGAAGKLETALFLLAVYLTSIVRIQDSGQELSEKLRDSLKLVRKSVWSVCSDVVTDCRDQYSTNTAGLSVRVLCLLSKLSSQARKKLMKMVNSWDNQDTSWTRHQVWVTGCVVGGGGGDGFLCGLAAGRLLSRLVSGASAEQEEGEQEEGEQEEGEKEEDLQLLRSVFQAWSKLKGGEEGGGKCYPTVEPHLWNDFVEKALESRGGSIKLSSSLGVMCDGVRVLYGGSGEGDGEGREEGFVSLEELHKKVWSHSEFLDVMNSFPVDPDNVGSAKVSLVELLVRVCERYPRVCETAHVATLLGAYSATRSKTDRGLLYLLLLYELNGADVGRFKPFLWGEAGRCLQAQRRGVSWLQWVGPGARQVLDSLDLQRMRHSVKCFPQQAPLEPSNPFSERECAGSSEEQEEGSSVYDPAFLLPLLSHLLDPVSLVECRGVVERGCLGYLLAALSSQVAEVRTAAAHCLSRFSAHLRASSDREKPQMSLLLKVVKNSLQEETQRLSSLHTAFCAQVASIFLNPELLLYPVVGHCVVHRPALELRDIPLFYTLLHSSSTQHCSERCWLLGVLVSGLQCEADYRLYQSKRVLPHLLALYTAPCLDDRARGLILELLLRACSIPMAASDLVWNHGLLIWLAQVTSGSTIVLQILSELCRVLGTAAVLGQGVGEGGGCSSRQTVKPPPLLEEELTLTASRVVTLSQCFT